MKDKKIPKWAIVTLIALALTLINWMVIIRTDIDTPKEQDQFQYYRDSHISIPTPIGIIVYGNARDNFPCGDFPCDMVARLSSYKGILIGGFGVYVPLVLGP